MYCFEGVDGTEGGKGYSFGLPKVVLEEGILLQELYVGAQVFTGLVVSNYYNLIFLVVFVLSDEVIDGVVDLKCFDVECVCGWFG